MFRCRLCENELNAQDGLLFDVLVCPECQAEFVLASVAVTLPAVQIRSADGDVMTFPETPLDTDSRIFVQQLQAIGINTSYLERCILDYYSAFEQRARWIRKNLIVDGEIERYERRLVHEWELFSEICISELGDHATEEELRQCGLAILNQMQTKDIRIRDKVREPYVMTFPETSANEIELVPLLPFVRNAFCWAQFMAFVAAGEDIP